MYIGVEGVRFSGIKAGQTFQPVCCTLCVISCDYLVVYVGIIAFFSYDCMKLIDARDMPCILNVRYTIMCGRTLRQAVMRCK